MASEFGAHISFFENLTGSVDCALEIFRKDENEHAVLTYREVHELPSVLGCCDVKEWLKENLVAVIETL